MVLVSCISTFSTIYLVEVDLEAEARSYYNSSCPLCLPYKVGFPWMKTAFSQTLIINSQISITFMLKPCLSSHFMFHSCFLESFHSNVALCTDGIILTQLFISVICFEKLIFSSIFLQNGISVNHLFFYHNESLAPCLYHKVCFVI